MKNKTKIQVAGVGGQGVVFLTNLIVEAALISNIPVATSEIHGLFHQTGIISPIKVIALFGQTSIHKPQFVHF